MKEDANKTVQALKEIRQDRVVNVGMTDQDWKDMGYRYWPQNDDFKKGLWQRKLFQPDGHERSGSLGYLNWWVYVFPDRTGYMAEADIDMSDGPMGIRRMTWNPRALTTEIVRMVENDYVQMAGYTELYRKQNP